MGWPSEVHYRRLLLIVLQRLVAVKQRWPVAFGLSAETSICAHPLGIPLQVQLQPATASTATAATALAASVANCAGRAAEGGRPLAAVVAAASGRLCRLSKQQQVEHILVVVTQPPTMLRYDGMNTARSRPQFLRQHSPAVQQQQAVQL